MSELTFDDLSDDQKSAHDRVIHNIQNAIHTTITGGLVLVKQHWLSLSLTL